MKKKHVIWWIIPNVFLHIVWLCLTVWVVFNLQVINEIDLLAIWFLVLGALFTVNLFATAKIWNWHRKITS